MIFSLFSLEIIKFSVVAYKTQEESEKISAVRMAERKIGIEFNCVNRVVSRNAFLLICFASLNESLLSSLLLTMRSFTEVEH